MLWALIILIMIILLTLPAEIRTELRHTDATQLFIRLQITGIHRTWRLLLLRTAVGHRLVLDGKNGLQPLDPQSFRRSRGSTLLTALGQEKSIRRYLLQHLHLQTLEAFALLRTDDAAHSALLSGALQAILSSFPSFRRKARIRIFPEFFRGHSTVLAKCIIRIRLGTILLTAMMLLAAQHRQHQKKARQIYGTSHW